ncbi:MAG TPA: hypothetical protein VJW55_13985 [Candidatus Angelobacter sp.]|nr:hypothetical protein [Candidatus Angelobacter sp.]
MQKMTKQEAFWQALAIVSAAALLMFSALLYFLSPHYSYWPAVLLVILIPVLVLLPFAYHQYRNGRPQLTRRQYLNRSVLYGLITAIYLGDNILDPRTGWRLVIALSGVGGWALLTLDHLLHAYKMKKEETELTSAS